MVHTWSICMIYSYIYFVIKHQCKKPMELFQCQHVLINQSPHGILLFKVSVIYIKIYYVLQCIIFAVYSCIGAYKQKV